MANYNIIIDNNHFKPFSYKDIMAPYDDYAKDYDAEAERIHKFIDYGKFTNRFKRVPRVLGCTRSTE